MDLGGGAPPGVDWVFCVGVGCGDGFVSLHVCDMVLFLVWEPNGFSKRSCGHEPNHEPRFPPCFEPPVEKSQ